MAMGSDNINENMKVQHSLHNKGNDQQWVCDKERKQNQGWGNTYIQFEVHDLNTLGVLQIIEWK